MNNPNGPYPGRQLFLGQSLRGEPVFAYLITGRSPESRERKAVQVDNSIRIGPAGDQPYDPLRHYSALKYDLASGMAAISNGIQTEAIFEMYKLLFNAKSQPGPDYLEKILEGAGAEPDSYHTPRIAGVFTWTLENQANPLFLLGIKGHSSPAKATIVKPVLGTLVGISTYRGPLDNPEVRTPVDALPELEFKGKTAAELARLVFDISAVIHKGNDIRVCSLAGILSAEQQWTIHVHNVLQ